MLLSIGFVFVVLLSVFVVVLSVLIVVLEFVLEDVVVLTFDGVFELVFYVVELELVSV